MIRAALLSCLAAELGAQPARVTGHVFVSGDTTRVLSGVEITLLPGFRTARSDSTGNFRLTNIQAGTYTVRARRVGFEVSTAEVTLAAGTEHSVNLAMRVGPQALAEVTINGRRTLYPARYADAYERVAHGNGAFFTRELIDSLQPYDVRSLLPRIPGVQVNDRSVRFQRCQTGALLGSEAHVQVYVDGVRVTNYNDPRLPRDAYTAITEIVMSSVQLIEVYTGVSRIPVQFLDDACAVIVVWTK